MEADGGDRKVGALLQTVDELVKIAPDLKMVGSGGSARNSDCCRRPPLWPEICARRSSRWNGSATRSDWSPRGSWTRSSGPPKKKWRRAARRSPSCSAIFWSFGMFMPSCVPPTRS